MALVLLAQVVHGQPTGGSPKVALTGQVELARLVDLCAERLNLHIEYNAADLKSTVTLRLAEDLTDEQLWKLTNQLLAVRGLASVQAPGERLVSIVKVADAQAVARLEDLDRAPLAGFVNLVTDVKGISSKEAADAVKLILSKPSGSVSALGPQLVLISDFKPRVDDALRLIELMQTTAGSGSQPVIERIAIEQVESTQLAASVSAAATARDAVSSRPLRGKVLGAPDGASVILVSPREEIQFWRDLISDFDRRDPVDTKTYVTVNFGPAEVAKLIEQTLRGTATATAQSRSGDRFRVVIDDLTGALIITATAGEHRQIEEILLRLQSVPPEGRRPVRSFKIRNRRVTEIADVLTRLIDAGALSAGDSDREVTSTGLLQQSIRDPLAAVSPPQVAPEAQNAAAAAPQNREIASTISPLIDYSTAAPNASQPLRHDAGDPAMFRNKTVGGAGVPRLSLTVDEGTNTLIAIGESRLLGQLEQLIAELDVRQTQVMLEVLVVNLNEADTLDLGVELQKIEISGGTFVRLSSLFGLGDIPLDAPPSAAVGSGFTGVVLNPGDFSVLLRALQTLNRGRSLSLPKVLVNNNQQATLNSVLQQPFASTNASDTVATTSFGGTQDAGTTVTVKPQIAEADHLILEYTVSLSAFVGDAADPRLPPPRQQNNLTSVVSIPDGHTIVVGGLEITSETEATSQVPLLGDIPLLGEAFKSRSNSVSRSRFFVFIRSNILRHNRFEDLKFISEQDAASATLEPDWPEVHPRIIR